MKNCPYCNSPMQENAEFCLHCMRSASVKKDITPEKKDPSKKALIIPLCIVSAVLVMFVAGFFYFWVSPEFSAFLKKEDTKPKKPESSTGAKAPENTTEAETTYAFLSSEKPEDVDKSEDTVKKDPPAETASPKPVQKETDSPVSQSPCAYGHTWKAIKKTVHKDEVGHYENTLVGYKNVTAYKCPLCYKDPFETLDLYYEHYSTHILYEGDPAGMLKERYEVVTESVPQYEDKWIVDTPAYDEEITVGYICTVCNEEKEN